MKHKITRGLALFMILVIIIPAALIGCRKNDSEYRDFNLFVMDTYVTLRFAANNSDGAPLSEDYLTSVADECEAILAEIDNSISCHNENSDVYALNRDVSMLLNANSTLISLIETSSVLSSLTDGAYDHSLGALTKLWNVTGGGPVPSSEDIEVALSHAGSDKFAVDGTDIKKSDPEAQLDFGAIGKGLAAQMILEYLSGTDIPYGIVSVGGNIGVFGEKPDLESYKIGIRNPDDSSKVLGYLYIPSGFISVSGSYERFFEQDGKIYHHILDPKTGYPAETGVKTVAVYSTNGTTADALSTALFVLGVEKSLELYNNGKLRFEAVFVLDDGSITTTPGIDESMFEIYSENDAESGK